MKKLAILILSALFLITGCQDDNSILEPNNNYASDELNKRRRETTTDDYDQDTNTSESDYSSSSNEPDWLTIPSSGLEMVTSKMVNGSEETLLDLNTNIQGGIFGNIQINATLRFLRGAFEGSRYVTMSINSDYGTASFSPSGEFDIPAIYNSTIMGLDLSGINPDEIEFVYMGTDGKYYSIDVQNILVEPQSGKLQVINAKIPHFSRYGWTRTGTSE